MQKTILPSKITGTVKAPASKSFMQRAIALAILANGKTEISNATYCNDALAALSIAEAWGCEVVRDDNKVLINSTNKKVPQQLNCGESGLGIRMFTPLAGLEEAEVELIGEGSLTQRPLKFMEPTLSQLGVTLKTNGKYLPLHVKGPMLGGEAYLDGSLSSQFLTGLLIALPMASYPSVLHVSKLRSKPYIDMTLKIVESFGGQIENDNYETFRIPANQSFSPCNYSVEGDWSGAAALLVAGAIGGSVTVTGLDARSVQADVAVLDAIKQTGALVKTPFQRVMVEKAEQLKPFEIDLTHCPDLFPVLAALAANCQGQSVLHGVERLKHKESDRGLAIQQEFAKIGIEVVVEENSMKIKGSKISGGECSAHNDHRMVMALSLMALNAEHAITIQEAESIDKSYKEFFTDLEALLIKK